MEIVKKLMKPFKVELLTYPRGHPCGACGKQKTDMTAVWPFKPKTPGEPPKKVLCNACAPDAYDLS